MDTPGKGSQTFHIDINKEFFISDKAMKYELSKKLEEFLSKVDHLKEKPKLKQIELDW